ncbi:HNH endonuclease, partial [Vibrio cholerae]
LVVMRCQPLRRALCPRRVIDSINQLESNLALFEKYLSEGTEEEQWFVYELIKRGTCFVSYDVRGEIRFSPSRYIGYAENTMDKHKAHTGKDGRETNPAITKVLGVSLESNSNIEGKFLEFCQNIGVNPDNKSRKYWFYKIDHHDFPDNESSDEGFPEGKIVERTHKYRERNPELKSKAKAKYLDKNGNLSCMVCEFDFSKVYGDRGAGYIEAHHTIPVSEMKPGEKTKLEDIALVCSNCHKMIHRYRPWLGMDDLKNILNSKA